MAKTSKELEISKLVPNYFSNTEIIPTDIFALDFILRGGLELGSSVQIVGESGCGKSTLALQLAKNICSQGKKVIYIDSERSISNELIDSMRLKEHLNNEFIYIRESTFTNVEKYLDMLIHSNLEISCIIVDSLANLINEGFLEKDGISITTKNTSYSSVPLVHFMNKYKALASSKQFALVLINHYRQKVDMGKGKVAGIGTIQKEYGSKNTKYNSDVILCMKSIKSTSKNINFKGMPIDNGTELEFEVVKSNKSAPNESIPFFLMYGTGISNIVNYIYALINIGIIKQNVSYFSLECNNVKLQEQGLMKLYNKILELDIDLTTYEDKIINYYNNPVTK